MYRYKSGLWWEDKTVDYLTPYVIKTASRPRCGFWIHGRFDGFLSLQSCESPESLEDFQFYRLNLLCEITTEEGARVGTGTAKLASSLQALTPSLSVDVVACPNGHVVHSFLACDVPSACFARADSLSFDGSRNNWDIPLGTSCLAPLTSLPPSFACEDGSQRVPYNVVCDHRQDCQDNSDEDFCVFPQCPTGSLACADSKQVDIVNAENRRIA